MDTKAFLGIEPSGVFGPTNGRWSMVVRPGLVTGGNFLWGGCGLAAAVMAHAVSVVARIAWLSGLASDACLYPRYFFNAQRGVLPERCGRP